MKKEKNIKAIEQFLKSNSEYAIAMKIRIVDNEVILRDYDNIIEIQRANIENTEEVKSLIENAKIDFVGNEIIEILHQVDKTIKSIEEENEDFICEECIETIEKLKMIRNRIDMLSNYMIFKF